MQSLAALKYAAHITNKKLCLSQEWQGQSDLFHVHAAYAERALLSSEP